MRKVLIIDDDVAVTNYFRVFLVQSGLFEPTVINDSRNVDGILARERFDVIVLDLDMPNVSGIDILRNMRSKGDTTPVVILTGVSDVDLAVRSMKLGAFDYLIKPVEEDSFLQVLNNAIETRALRESLEKLPDKLSREDLAHEAAFKHLVTQDKGMIQLFHRAEKLAASDVSIFIWGESGSGKEMLARAIHNASPRRDGPFIVVEADSQSAEEFAGFFFGRARDWRGEREETPGMLEQADKGTLFLNHIDVLTLPVQVRLRRLLQTGEYYRENSTAIKRANVRIIASCMHDLTRPEYADRFSHDLLYHLMVNSLRIPPLRERPGDIPLLANHFLVEEAEKAGRKITGFSPACMKLLEQYSYPGNVQELRSIVAGAVANTEGELVEENNLPPTIRERIERGETLAFMPKRLEEVIREHVRNTLAHFGQQREVAARVLGIEPAEIDRIIGEDLAED